MIFIKNMLIIAVKRKKLKIFVPNVLKINVI
jgi:hypothetical protein